MSQYEVPGDDLVMPSKDKKPAPEIAKQALEEANARREARKVAGAEKEFNGRKGPDPARYGDWENKGIASDF